MDHPRPGQRSRAPQYPKIKITVKNYGQTPALLQWWTLCFTCQELPDIPIYEGPASGIPLEKMAVQAGDTFTLPGFPSWHRQEFSLDEVKAIMTRDATFTAYGYICYGDIFGNPVRRLKFCEMVLNIFDGSEQICDWWSGFSPDAYVGTDSLPERKNTKQKANEDTTQNPANRKLSKSKLSQPRGLE